MLVFKDGESEPLGSLTLADGSIINPDGTYAENMHSLVGSPTQSWRPWLDWTPLAPQWPHVCIKLGPSLPL